MSDFKIQESDFFGSYDVGVFLQDGEQDVRFYIGVLQHETLHKVLLKECGIPLEKQPDWLLDQIQIWTGFWLDM